MKMMKSYLKGYREIIKLEPRLIPTVLLLAISSAIAPFINIYFSAEIIDELSNSKDIKKLIIFVSIALSLNFVLYIINNSLGYRQYNLRSLMYNKERDKIATKLYNVDYQKLENSDFQELIHLHNESMDRIFSAFVQLTWMLRDFVTGVLTVGISLIMIAPLIKIGLTKTGESFLEKPIFLIVLVAFIVVALVIVLLASQKMSKQWFAANDKYSRIERLFHHYRDMFTDYNTGKEIRIFNEQKLIHDDATKEILDDGEKIIQKVANNSAKSSSLVAIIGALLGFGIYLFIGTKGLFGLIGIGALVKYAGAFMQVVAGFTNIAVTLGKGNEMIPTIEQYFDIMDTEDVLKYGDKVIDTDIIDIEFKNVFFKYPGTDKYALEDISIKINDGEHFAVVGRNGSGKTTFIKLLCRFYDVNGGEILLNGVNIKEYTKESLENLFSVVFQDYAMFAFSVGENIASSDVYDDEKVEKCLDESGILERVKKMPNGIENHIYKDLDEDGIEISGGESQKMALSRALYKDSPIVVLDEPTAALDPVAEFEVYEKFNSFVENKTAIFISHRFSSCRFCEKIAVFDLGKLVQCDSHEVLVEEINGKYFELWNAQAKYYL